MNRLLDALSFAAHHHKDQRRKGADARPYINHPIEVARLLSEVGGVTDEALLCAAVLHDTVEDTEATAEDIQARFGQAVAGIVAEVTDDKALPKLERKRLQVEHASHKSPEAKQLKLADKISNVTDLVADPPSWPLDRVAQYADWSESVVAGLRGANPALEALFDERIAALRAHITTRRAEEA